MKTGIEAINEVLKDFKTLNTEIIEKRTGSKGYWLNGKATIHTPTVVDVPFKLASSNTIEELDLIYEYVDRAVLPLKCTEEEVGIAARLIKARASRFLADTPGAMVSTATFQMPGMTEFYRLSQEENSVEIRFYMDVFKQRNN